MKAHVATEGEACEPTVIKGLTEDDWEMLHDLGVSMTEMSIVSEMSLETAVFALQQIELHLETLTFEPGQTYDIRTVMGAISRIRILVVTTLVSLGVLGDLPTDEDGKPAPVTLPSLGIADQHDTLRRLTNKRESSGD